MPTVNKLTGTVCDTIAFSRAEAESWPLPPIQRDAKPNAKKVVEVKDKLKANGGVVPGIITFGILDGKKYLVDGQQRRLAFMLSEVTTGYADTRTKFFATLQDLADEFVALNSNLVPMTPDDILRAKEVGNPAMQLIRRECPFVGYANVRRAANNPMLSMSTAIRIWYAAGADTPRSAVPSSKVLVDTMAVDDAANLCRFLKCCMKAWGVDREYHSLWTTLTMTVCAWIYRRTALDRYSLKSRTFTDAEFTHLLMALSADVGFMAWVASRRMNERERGPAYNRIKEIFSNRVKADTGTRPFLPSPEWSHGRR